MAVPLTAVLRIVVSSVSHPLAQFVGRVLSGEHAPHDNAAHGRAEPLALEDGQAVGGKNGDAQAFALL